MSANTAERSRPLTACQTSRGQKMSFAARLTPSAAPPAHARSRKRHASAAPRASGIVMLPVWIAEITGGQMSAAP